MQEQVLEKLIALYQAKGVRLDSIVNSDLFRSLPVEKRIQVIKAVGEKSKQTMGPFTKDDAKKILVGLGLGTLAAVYGHNIYKAFTGSIAAGTGGLPSFSLLTGVGATGAASIGSLMSARNNYVDRQRLRQMNTQDTDSILNYLAGR